ncbi:KTSC domain-containing protein [Acidiluteibacter ferrifornacis]|uniref:KTSC domain-containing protein n=1 Tax=Acidiluteibacter ferrifornacis TaxID=2692424 RepID=A0A6N9NN02_9FLAO|nr:KTSC domain-containing protein [Acidiluteibacter ferrifornacis]NBG67343.1 KTSC domain-containing protein [Acidiluteibacter ferrifornacis]
MKRINEYKKLFSVENEIDLKQIKTTYRNLVKEWHPDKFQADDSKAEEADRMSKQIIDGYHFLVSIAPETKAANLEEYTKMLDTEGVVDYKHKGLLMDVTFTDGSTYEYFGVNAKLFQKFVNSDKQMRFGKRNIFNTFLYRKSKKGSDQE